MVRTAAAIGTTLGHLSKRVDSWKEQRAEIVAEVEHVLRAARRVLAELGHGTKGEGRRRGGRPKGYRTSEETRAKLRAAWKARREAGDDKPVHKRDASEAARAKIAAAVKARTRVKKG